MRFVAQVFVLSLMTASAMAQSLGAHGKVYPIEEQDGVDYIKSRMKGFYEDGTVARKQEEARQRVRKTILEPEPLPGITTATQTRTFFFDPSTVTTKPLADTHGRILFPAGTKVNPLQYRSLSSRYIFIDGRNEKQIAFAKKNARFGKDKIVLVAGSWVELSKKNKTQIYFDQHGVLTTHFGIKHVPALLEQSGLMIKIQEFSL